jgi:hypothetical protein
MKEIKEIWTEVAGLKRQYFSDFDPNEMLRFQGHVFLKVDDGAME